MKGIILAGGAGTRLYPITKGISKQLLPIYDKPMIYYPLSVLLLAGIKDILVISTPEDIYNFEKLLGDGFCWGIKITYKIQPSPDGIAQAFIIAEDFIGKDPVCLVLGDNIFYGHGLTNLLQNAVNRINKECKSTIFGYSVHDPERYGVVEFDTKGKVISIEEKPENPKSNYAVIGLYFYTNDVVEIAKTLKPSTRGELEITSVNKEYLKRSTLQIELMGRGYAWLDTGTHESLLEAGLFIQTIEKRQGLKVACIEEIVYDLGYINKTQLTDLIEPLKKTAYGQYLKKNTKKLKFTTTHIEDLIIIEPIVFGDDRGYFFESYNQFRFDENKLNVNFIQDNEAKSQQGVLRGLHYQNPPYTQTKLIRVISGEILDVVVDLRKSSKTYGKHFSIVLDDKNKFQLLVPKGFAHGYIVLNKEAIVSYKVDEKYMPEHEDGIIWNDSDLKINWIVSENDIILSSKDKLLRKFNQLNTPF